MKFFFPRIFAIIMYISSVYLDRFNNLQFVDTALLRWSYGPQTDMHPHLRSSALGDCIFSLMLNVIWLHSICNTFMFGTMATVRTCVDSLHECEWESEWIVTLTPLTLSSSTTICFDISFIKFCFWLNDSCWRGGGGSANTTGHIVKTLLFNFDLTTIHRIIIFVLCICCCCFCWGVILVIVFTACVVVVVAIVACLFNGYKNWHVVVRGLIWIVVVVVGFQDLSVVIVIVCFLL